MEIGLNMNPKLRSIYDENNGGFNFFNGRILISKLPEYKC